MLFFNTLHTLGPSPPSSSAKASDTKSEGGFTRDFDEKLLVGEERILEEGRIREGLVGLGATGESAMMTQGKLGDIESTVSFGTDGFSS